MSYRPPLWKTAYSVDFTAQTTQNLKTGGNGTKTIDSKSWTWANDANANTADVTNGTGIVIAATNTSTSYTNAARTGPILSIPVTSLFSTFHLFRHVLRLQIRMLLTNSITNSEVGGFGFEYTTTPVNQFYHLSKGFIGGSANRFLTEDSFGGLTTRQTSSSSTDDILALIYRPPMSYATFSGTFSSLPMNAATSRIGVVQGGSGTISVNGDITIGLYMTTGNTQGQTDGFKVTFTHLQLDYIDVLPLVVSSF